jgi:hypothetical protein
MDAEFMRRLHASLPPFDGVALRAGDPTPLTALQAALRSMAVYLHDQWQQEPLFAVREEYDPEGVSFVAKGTTWDNLLQIVSSAASLQEVGRDHNVLITAFFPESREFYLRIYVPEEARQPVSAEWAGGFDLTGSKELIDQVEGSIRGTGDVDLVREPAKLYHDRWWGC